MHDLEWPQPEGVSKILVAHGVPKQKHLADEVSHPFNVLRIRVMNYSLSHGHLVNIGKVN